MKLWNVILVVQGLWCIVTIAAPDYLWMSLTLSTDFPPLSNRIVLLIRWAQIDLLAAVCVGILIQEKSVIPHWLMHLFLVLTYSIVLENVWLLLAESVLIASCLLIQIITIRRLPPPPENDIYVPGYSHWMLQIFSWSQLFLTIMCAFYMTGARTEVVLFVIFAIHTFSMQVLNLATIYAVMRLEITMIVAMLNALACFTRALVYGLGHNLPSSTAEYGLFEAFVACQFASGLGFLISAILDLVPP